MNNNLLKLSVLGFLGVCVLSSGAEGMNIDSVKTVLGMGRNELVKNYKAVAAYLKGAGKSEWESKDNAVKKSWVNSVLARCGDVSDSYGKAPVKGPSQQAPGGRSEVATDIMSKINNGNLEPNDLIEIFKSGKVERGKVTRGSLELYCLDLANSNKTKVTAASGIVVDNVYVFENLMTEDVFVHTDNDMIVVEVNGSQTDCCSFNEGKTVICDICGLN